ncbi:protein Fe65 homolog [Dermatophagoides farinae]|uniref:protein Fe65 homolog n=1 Tax=Dermatophagoides farinae TaxID=6954 RepID=UPI003F61C647
MMADTDQFANESITNVDKLISNQQQQQHSKNVKKSYENPNYRKLYAKLSMNTMIGTNESSSINNNHDDNAEMNPFSFGEDEDDDDDDDDSLANEEEEDDDDDEYEDLSSGDENVKQNLLQQQSNDSKKSQTSIDLPDGWERHEDELGSYFWHIPTGTIQRERPYLNTIDKSMIRSDSLVFLDKSAINIDYNPADSIEENPDGESKETENHDVADDDDDDDDETTSIAKELSFIVHSLGWLDVDESQINSQTGSMVIKRCIYELSTRAENAARCWGPSDTQSLILKINNERISLLEPNTSTTLTIQLIREIRMWAVDDNNNFAYVVKDRKSGKPGTVKCHIFHCDEQQQQQTAQRLALYLKDALVRIKNHQQNRNERRPNDLLLKSNNNNSITMMDNFEFPTPIEEPKKCIQALYIGFIPVTKPMGVDILNMAIEEIINSLKMSLTNENHDEIELMRPVLVNISPSNIVVECQETGATLVECRVRYLSFLGISLDNVKRCGFIMQVNEKEFVCHCFQVEPSAGALCKIIEAACKLRYQKCLDAHSNKQQPKQNNNSVATSKSTTTTTTTTTNSSPVAALKSSISGVFSKILNKTSTATTTSHQ